MPAHPSATRFRYRTRRLNATTPMAATTTASTTMTTSTTTPDSLAYPVGAPWTLCHAGQPLVAVAQLVRAPGCGPGSRGVESPRSPVLRPEAAIVRRRLAPQ